VPKATPTIKTIAKTTIPRINRIGFFFFGASAPSSGAASGAAVAMEYSSKSQFQA